MRRFKKAAMVVILCYLAVSILMGCEFVSTLKELKGDLIGEAFQCIFYNDSGSKILTVDGNRVNVSGNRIEQYSYNSDGTLSTRYELSSVITIDVDGHQISSCGDTILFAEKGIEPVVDFELETTKGSNEGDITEATFISGIVNHFANYFGKSCVVVIKSQTGNPICVYVGDSVYWEVCEDLPKTTRLLIDGKSMYIHRANFQIIDRALISSGQ